MKTKRTPKQSAEIVEIICTKVNGLVKSECKKHKFPEEHIRRVLGFDQLTDKN